MKKPNCPNCGRKGKPDGTAGGRQRYRCPLGHLFDGNPLEGGTHHDIDPSRRMEQQEELDRARQANASRRVNSSKPFRF